MAQLPGHDARVGRVAFHPGGRLLGTTWFVCFKLPLLHAIRGGSDVSDRQWPTL